MPSPAPVATDALFMVLMAWEVGPRDAVYPPSFTFCATAEAAALAGARPGTCLTCTALTRSGVGRPVRRDQFVDVRPDTYNLELCDGVNCGRMPGALLNAWLGLGLGLG
jgi:hypothetical protein